LSQPVPSRPDPPVDLTRGYLWRMQHELAGKLGEFDSGWRVVHQSPIGNTHRKSLRYHDVVESSSYPSCLHLFVFLGANPTRIQSYRALTNRRCGRGHLSDKQTDTKNDR